MSKMRDNTYGLTTKAHKKAIEFIDLLQEKYPIVFPHNPEPKLPLMVGISEQLLNNGEFNVDIKVINNALKLWCMGERYYTALSISGAPRFDLNGNKVGEVTEQEAEKARKNLKNPPVINRKIEDLGLSVRTYNLLKRAKIQFESDLKERIDSLGDIMGMGKKSLEEIKLALTSQQVSNYSYDKKD